jgi:hypothetical protein
MRFPEAAVTRRAETLDDVLAQRLGTPTGRLLDRLDAAIISIGRGIWRLVVDGLVASAHAECVPPIDSPFDRVDEHRCEQEVLPDIQYTYAVPSESYIVGDFEDLPSLIEGIRAMGGQRFPNGR